MSKAKERAETEDEDATLARELSVSRYPGREPVTVRTTQVPGEEPSPEERMLAGVRRLAQEGRI
jgi:hypothetical protein